MAICPAKNDHPQKKTLASLLQFASIGRPQKPDISFSPDVISGTTNLYSGYQNV
jgi:hypothetical protein